MPWPHASALLEGDASSADSRLDMRRSPSVVAEDTAALEVLAAAVATSLLRRMSSRVAECASSEERSRVSQWTYKQVRNPDIGQVRVSDVNCDVRVIILFVNEVRVTHYTLLKRSCLARGDQRDCVEAIGLSSTLA